MSWIEIVADRKIRDAQEEGAFDNLPGKGKPLNLDFDPRVPAELRAAYRIMKDASVLPDWIQLEKEIRQAEERWEERLAAYVRHREAELAQVERTRNGTAIADVDRARERFLVQAATALRDLNRQIDRLNLIVPTLSRQRLKVDARARVAELEERFPRLQPYPRGVQAPWMEVLAEKREPTRLSNRMPLRRKTDPIG